jgi:hypothetical protein
VPAPLIVISRLPATVSFSGEANAPSAFFVVQLDISAFHSASVGKRKPVGHGLLIPLTPCHKFTFAGLLQSVSGVFGKIKFALPGTSVFDCVAMVMDFQDWC